MSGEYFDVEMKAHEAEMKAIMERQEAEQKATIEKHEGEGEGLMERGKEEISAAMQAFETKVADRRVYHEAPNDVFELIVIQLMWGRSAGIGVGA